MRPEMALLLCQFLALIATTFTLTQLSNERQWSEQDESKRIAQLKREEMQVFKKEMGGGRLPLLSSEQRGGIQQQQRNYDSQDGFFDYDPTAGLFSQKETSKSWSAPTQSLFLSPTRQQQRTSSRSGVAPAQNLSVSLGTLPQNWCFTCASPWSSISSEMQQVIRNLLELRRGEFPQTAVTNECVSPRKLDNLARQSCLYSYCQTLVLTDHEAGTSFTLRGCAEKFGAIDEKALAKQGDNVCKRLHKGIDIKECICRDRKYCYTGPERRNLKYTEHVPVEGGRSSSIRGITMAVSAERSVLCAYSPFITMATSLFTVFFVLFLSSRL